MPWTAELRAEPQFPSVCPYCSDRPATTRIHVPHAQATGFYGVAITRQLYTFFFPCCAPCAGAFGRAQRAGVLLILAPWALWFVLLFAPGAAGLVTPLLGLALACTVVGIGLLVWRRLRTRAVRILHVGQDGVTYGFSREDYARRFADVNGVEAVWKLLVVKVV